MDQPFGSLYLEEEMQGPSPSRGEGGHAHPPQPHSCVGILSWGL